MKFQSLFLSDYSYTLPSVPKQARTISGHRESPSASLTGKRWTRPLLILAFILRGVTMAGSHCCRHTVQDRLTAPGWSVEDKAERPGEATLPRRGDTATARYRRQGLPRTTRSHTAGAVPAEGNPPEGQPAAQCNEAPAAGRHLGSRDPERRSAARPGR